MFESKILKLVEQHVLDLFEKKIAAEDLYHNLSHTIEVVKVSDKIALDEMLSDNDIEILLIAAWFHDTGHFNCCNGHEDKSVEFAIDYLNNESYPQHKIDRIVGCIKATKIPQNPKNKLEQIICDADLQHLGMADIEERGFTLRKELEIKGIKKVDDVVWLKSSMEFLSNHKFFTDYAIKTFGEQKKINQINLEQKLKILQSKVITDN
ncbi:MAG: HD domain-containing protein [Ignavibacteriota bacterium]